MESLISRVIGLARTPAFAWTLPDGLACAKALGYSEVLRREAGRYVRIDLSGSGPDDFACARLMDGRFAQLDFRLRLYPAVMDGTEIAYEQLRAESLASFRSAANEVTENLGQPVFEGTPVDPGYPPDHAASRVVVWKLAGCRVIVYWDYEDDRSPTTVGIALADLHPES